MSNEQRDAAALRTTRLAKRVWFLPGVAGQIYSYITPAEGVAKLATLSKSSFEQFLLAHGSTIDLWRYQDFTHAGIHLVSTLSHLFTLA
jgi:hypothetical protein